jgi:hypothetical protein
MDARQQRRVLIFLVPLAPQAWDQHLPALRCSENPCAEGTLECGGLTPPSACLLHRASRGASPAAGPAAFMAGIFQGGVKPPHSKALRAFSCKVVRRRIMESMLRAGSKGRRHIQNGTLPEKILKTEGTNLRIYWKQRS